MGAPAKSNGGSLPAGSLPVKTFRMRPGEQRNASPIQEHRDTKNNEDERPHDIPRSRRKNAHIAEQEENPYHDERERYEHGFMFLHELSTVYDGSGMGVNANLKNLPVTPARAGRVRGLRAQKTRTT